MQPNEIKKEDLLKQISHEIRVKFSTKGEAAEFFGISRTHLHRVLSEGHEIPDSMLKWVGYEKKTIVIYQQITKGKKK